jgi:hypothetical protein
MSKTYRDAHVDRVQELRRGSRTDRFSPTKDRRVKGGRSDQRRILATLNLKGEY